MKRREFLLQLTGLTLTAATGLHLPVAGRPAARFVPFAGHRVVLERREVRDPVTGLAVRLDGMGG